MCLRLMVLVITNDFNKSSVLIKKFIRSEIVNICLVFACVIMDRTLILSNIKFSWSIAIIFTTLVIFDEITSIASTAGETLGSQFIITVIKKINNILQNK